MTATYVNGFGLHTTLGRGVAANLDALLGEPRLPARLSVEFGGAALEVPYYLLADSPQDDPQARFECALHGVIEEALDAARLARSERLAMGLFIGSSCGEMPLIEAQYRDNLRASNDCVPMLETSGLGNLAHRLRDTFGIRGPDFSFYTACTASANSLLAAAAMIRAGVLAHALVVAVETSNAVTALGFNGLQLISTDLMRPFDRRRSGLVPGEGCAALVLSGARRDADWAVLGGAQLCDTHSISAANPDGSSIAEVIERCVRASGVAIDEIAALKMHGTASLLNDEAEAAGLRRTFDATPKLCALKPFIGHTYGACGVVELALFCGLVGRGRLPATPGICASESDLGIVLNQVAGPQPPGKFMLNYFGFGGSNTSLIVANGQ